MKTQLFQIWTYLSTTQIAADSSYVRFGLIASTLLILLGILIPLALWIRRKRNSDLWFGPMVRQLSFLARIAGIVWFLLFFLRYEDIYPLDRRIWVYLVVIPVIITGILMVRKYRRIKPLKMKSAELESRYKQYLPKAKAK